MPQNEKNSAVHNKKITRDNLYKNTKEQLKKSVIYTYNQQPRKQQRSTDKSTTSRLKHSKPLTLEKK